MSKPLSVSPVTTIESNGIGFDSKINPFAVPDGMMRNGSLEPNGHGKYDAFRSTTLDFDRVDNVEESGSELKTVDLDLFKDAAAAAFSEFGKSKHEYRSSKVAETNAFKMEAKNDNALDAKVMRTSYQ